MLTCEATGYGEITHANHMGRLVYYQNGSGGSIEERFRELRMEISPPPSTEAILRMIWAGSRVVCMEKMSDEFETD